MSPSEMLRELARSDGCMKRSVVAAHYLGGCIEDDDAVSRAIAREGGFVTLLKVIAEQEGERCDLNVIWKCSNAMALLAERQENLALFLDTVRAGGVSTLVAALHKALDSPESAARLSICRDVSFMFVKLVSNDVHSVPELLAVHAERPLLAALRAYATSDVDVASFATGSISLLAPAYPAISK